MVNAITKILLIDSHVLIREGLKLIFESNIGHVTFGEAGSNGDALALAREQDWDAVILEPFSGGATLEALVQIKASRPYLPVVIFTLNSESEYSEQALALGADGFIAKDRSVAEILQRFSNIMEVAANRS